MSRNYRELNVSHEIFDRKKEKKKKATRHSFYGPRRTVCVPACPAPFFSSYATNRLELNVRETEGREESGFFVLSSSFLLFHSRSVSLARPFGAIWRWSGTRCSAQAAPSLLPPLKHRDRSFYHVHPLVSSSTTRSLKSNHSALCRGSARATNATVILFLNPLSILYLSLFLSMPPPSPPSPP